MDIVKKSAICRFFYPNIYKHYQDSFNTTVNQINSDVPVDLIFLFHDFFCELNLDKNAKEMCEFEKKCCALFYKNRQECVFLFNRLCFISELTQQNSEILFNLSSSSYILTYITQDYRINHLTLNNEFLTSSDTRKKEFLDYLNIPEIDSMRGNFQLFESIKQRKNNCLNLQWHLTNRCEYKCKHCYLQEEDKVINCSNSKISLEYAKKIVDECLILSLKTNAPARIVLSGGDPLLCNYFWDILKYANKNNLYPMIIGILGNPDLINVEVAKRLKDLGIEHYQMSLEGLEEVNDEIRGRGNWNKVWKAIDVLEEAGIRTNIMFTVSRANFKQLIPLINYVGKTNKTDFSFARYCTAKQDDMLDMLSSEEYRTLLLRVVEAFRFWKQERHSIVQWDLAKDSLYAPLYEDMGINFYEIKSGCCLLGNGKSIAMLPSGHIFYCRRMPKEIGRWPLISIENALIEQKKFNINVYRDSKCLNCSARNSCRGGCFAVNYRVNKNKTNIDPQCWR